MMILNGKPILIGVRDVTKRSDEEAWDMTLDLEGVEGAYSQPFLYRESDPYGIAPQVKQWFADFGGLPT